MGMGVDEGLNRGVGVGLTWFCAPLSGLLSSLIRLPFEKEQVNKAKIANNTVVMAGIRCICFNYNLFFRKIHADNRKMRGLSLFSCILILVAVLPFQVHAQAAVSGLAPSGFRSIKLGMDLESVKKALKEDPYFRYRGDPDVSFLPFREQTLIECEGNTYIDRAYFQFHENKLYIIILVMNREKVDYYSLFTTFTRKYGINTSLNPQEVIWDGTATRLSLEKPASVKYIKKDVFEKLKVEGQATQSLAEQSLKEFLDQF
jgi:hypothetical protein